MFTAKQQEFFKNANSRWNIKQGATRSGKTYMDYYVIPKRIRRLKGKEGLVVLLGNTKGTLQRNIIEPLQDIWGHDLVGNIKSDNTAVLFGERCYCLGADKVNQVDRLRGSSIKYCYGDEVVTWHKDVFEMLKSRLDKPYSKFDGTCNPDSPYHWFKAFLDSDADIYNQQYRIDDNPYLDPVFVENLKKEYRGTVYYDRYILGDWTIAEGAIYNIFSDDKNRYRIDKAENIRDITIGVDFGGSASAHTFVATGLTRNGELVALASERHANMVNKQSTNIDPDKLGELFVSFCRRIIAQHGAIHRVYADSAEQTLIAGLRSSVRKEGLGWVQIDNALKTSINDRIRATVRLMAQSRFKYIAKECKSLEEALSGAVWNAKVLTKDERLDDGTSDIDTLDAFEYTFERNISRLIKLEMR